MKRAMLSMKSTASLRQCLFLAFFSLCLQRMTWAQAPGQTMPIKLGAYYFDGWTGLTKGHITKALVDSFAERESIWGWKTSTPAAMEAQIDSAARAGISFFSFCWYYPEADNANFRNHPLNHALGLYLHSPNRERLKFCLMVANHPGARIGPKDWNTVSAEWISLFKEKHYLTVEEQPLLIFFSCATLVDRFGSEQAVRGAFDSLRQACKNEGLNGVKIAACISPDEKAIAQAKSCGFDVLTGYNYHSVGFQPGKNEVPIDSLSTNSMKVWERLKRAQLPYIPVATLSWDPRPWAGTNKAYAISPRYVGFSPVSVYHSVKILRDWINQNQGQTTKEKIGLLYAWNEYGEGAWLTPSKNEKDHLLDGVKKGLQDR
jgi:hypothetical protein